MSHVLYSTSASASAQPMCLLVRDGLGGYRPAQAREVLQAAVDVLAEQVRGTDVMDAPRVVRDFLSIRLGGLPHEVFAVMHLDSQNRLIEYTEMFRGTVNQTSVYPREVVKDALAHNSAALILVHNHPSGDATPSRADEALTLRLKDALSLVDVRVLDHLIVAGPTIRSFAEMGLL
jgi:DNA repair protein RadC